MCFSKPSLLNHATTLGLLATIGFLSPKTEAASIYSQVAQVSGNGFSDFGTAIDDRTRVAMDAFEGDGRVRSGFAIARSSDGFLSGSVEAAITQIEDDAVASGSAGARASASLQISDVIVTKLPGFESLDDQVTLVAQVSFDSESAFGDLSNISGGISGGTGFDPTLLSSENTKMTSTAEVAVDETITLSLGASISVQVQGEFATRKGTFTVSLGGSPVFVVPEGYTANSIDGSVVDNFYVGPVDAVPEPTSLTIAAMLGFMGIARRRTRDR